MVKFVSDAPIENFEGITDKIDGYLYWEDPDITKNSAIYFEVDLNALDTGIGLRNRHMRENYLETDRFPLTYFKGKMISSNVVNDTTLSVEAEGVIFKTNGYRIQTNFIVKLSDFEIEIPSIMFYKINENMDIQLDFYVKEMND
jgi:polyisoprenoid-binding protein YceI